MTATCAQGALSRLYVEPAASPHTFDSSSESYEFLYENLRKQGRILGEHGIRGTRSRSKERLRNGAYTASGQIAMNVDPLALDLWLPRILGANESTDVFALADSIPAFGVLVNRVTQVSSGHFEYQDCYIDKAIIRGKAGPGDGNPDLIEMVLSIIAKKEVAGTSAPSVSLGTGANSAPYVFSDFSVVTIKGATRSLKDFTLYIDNHLQPRYVNSATPQVICPRDRTIMLRATFPFDDEHDDLHDIGATSSAATVTLTNGNLSTQFAFAGLVAPANSPFVRGKTEIDITLDFMAVMSGATKELIVTNDSAA